MDPQDPCAGSISRLDSCAQRPGGSISEMTDPSGSNTRVLLPIFWAISLAASEATSGDPSIVRRCHSMNGLSFFHSELLTCHVLQLPSKRFLMRYCRVLSSAAGASASPAARSMSAVICRTSGLVIKRMPTPAPKRNLIKPAPPAQQ